MTNRHWPQVWHGAKRLRWPDLHLPQVKLTPGLLALGVLAIFAVGLGLFGYGLWLAWPPAGPIGTGAVLMAWATFGDKERTE